MPYIITKDPAEDNLLPVLPQNPAEFKQVAVEFERANYAMSVDLPEMADPAALSAKLENGVLTVTVKKCVKNRVSPSDCESNKSSSTTTDWTFQEYVFGSPRCAASVFALYL
jgi:hypothetical protein